MCDRDVDILSFQHSYSSQATNRFLSKVNMEEIMVLPHLYAAL